MMYPCLNPTLKGTDVSIYPIISLTRLFLYIILTVPAPCKRSNLGPWSAPGARVHPQIVQQHSNLPDLGRYRTLTMRAKE